MVLSPLQATAQQTLGSLNGTVVDPSGAAIGGATVSVTNTAVNTTETTTTQKTGSFQIFNLQIGVYSIKVSHDGFETTTIPAVTVQEARATTMNVTLKVGNASESIEVVANPLLNATDVTNGYTLDQAQIQLTPLATGSFTQLAVLSPGVSAELLANLDTNAGLGNQNIVANGQRATSNTFQVNGVDVTNLFNGMSSSGDASQRYNFGVGETPTVGGEYGTGTSVYESNGNSLPSPPPEFMQELRVNTSMYDAQQGATAGAQIDASTMTGTNKLQFSECRSVLLQAGSASDFTAGNWCISDVHGESGVAPLDHRRDARRPDRQGQALLLHCLSALVQLGSGDGPVAIDGALRAHRRPLHCRPGKRPRQLDREGNDHHDQSRSHGSHERKAAGRVVHDSLSANQRALLVWSSQRNTGKEFDAGCRSGKWFHRLRSEPSRSAFVQVLLPERPGE
jgi:hypothetical protein